MKHFFTGILTLLIALLVSLLCVSFCLKDIVVNTLSKEVVESEVTNQVTKVIEDVYDDVDYDTLQKVENSISNSEELTDITKKYFDNIVDSIVNDTDVEIPNTKQEIISLINENEELLKENGIEFTDEQKQKVANEITQDEKLDKVYKNFSTSIKENMTDNEVKAVKVYNNITSTSFKWIIIAVIIILTILIAVIKKTYYRWTYNLAVSFAISGVLLTLLLPFVIDSISIEMTNKILGNSTSININSVINLGYISFVLCALFIIIYIIGNKITKYNDRKYA